jgi:hypothetical protein
MMMYYLQLNGRANMLPHPEDIATARPTQVLLKSYSRHCWDGVNERIIELWFQEALLPQSIFSGGFSPIVRKIFKFMAGAAAIDSGTLRRT